MARTNTKVNGRDYFRITRTIGHEMKNGKKIPIKKQFYGTSKTAAENKYKEWMLEQERKDQTVDSNRPLGQLCESYIENVLLPTSKYQESTKERYIGAWRRFAADDVTMITSKQIQNITSMDLQIAYNKYDAPQSAINSLHSFMKGFISWAVMNRYCTDVLSPVEIPKKAKVVRSEEVEVWSDDELDKIAEITLDHRLRLATFIGRYAGLRISEVLGLKYSDFTKDTLRVRRQDYRGHLKPPKYNSTRDIPLHPVLKEELAKHRQWHEAEMVRNGYKTDYVFTTYLGTRYDDSGIRKKFRKLYAANDMECKPFHTFRHTFCTNLCKAGVPIQTASKLMGHKSIEVTARFYTLVDQDEKTAAIGMLK